LLLHAARPCCTFLLHVHVQFQAPLSGHSLS
jgi:hypothetical protein